MNARCEYTGRRAHRVQKPACTDAHSAARHKCDHFSAAVDFNPDTKTGSIILNITCIASKAADEALNVVTSVLASPYAFSSGFAVARGGTCIGDFEVPAHTTAICTVCSMTLSGLLLRRGIHATAKFGGVVEVEHGQPKKFSAFLSSGPAPIAPLDVFITCAMTSVCKAIACGSGDVLGSFLEIPEACLPEAKKLYDRIKKIGMGGKIMFGMPSQPLLGMPVTIGSAGIMVFRDLNTAAALTEKGITAAAGTAKMLYDYAALEQSSQQPLIEAVSR